MIKKAFTRPRAHHYTPVCTVPLGGKAEMEFQSEACAANVSCLMKELFVFLP